MEYFPNSGHFWFSALSWKLDRSIVFAEPFYLAFLSGSWSFVSQDLLLLTSVVVFVPHDPNFTKVLFSPLARQSWTMSFSLDHAIAGCISVLAWWPITCFPWVALLLICRFCINFDEQRRYSCYRKNIRSTCIRQGLKGMIKPVKSQLLILFKYDLPFSCVRLSQVKHLSGQLHLLTYFLGQLQGLFILNLLVFF